MKVLVTGATGFVGPAVANAIVDAGHAVRVLERKPGAWKKAGIRCQEAVQGDVTDADSVRRAVRGHGRRRPPRRDPAGKARAVRHGS